MDDLGLQVPVLLNFLNPEGRSVINSTLNSYTSDDVIQLTTTDNNPIMMSNDNDIGNESTPQTNWKHVSYNFYIIENWIILTKKVIN